MHADPSVAVVVPVHNRVELTVRFLESFREVTYANHRMIVVDDGSSDATADRARKVGAKVIRHPVNGGKGAAVISGLAAAGCEQIVLIDGDGQHEPALVPELVAKLEEGNDLVVGDRFGADMNMPFHRRVANLLVRVIATPATGINDPLSGFRALRKSSFGNLREVGFNTELEVAFEAARKKLKVAQVPVPIRYLPGRSSKTSGLKAIPLYLGLLAYAVKRAILG